MTTINIWDEKCLISPSLICLDMINIKNQVKELEQAGIKLLHIDILDGHFSPSMPLGFELVKQLRKITSLPFECHVMATPPEYFVDELIKIGVQQITFHLESAPHVDGLINHIHNAGIRAGVALKPSTPLGEIEYILDKCDAVLLMQINPGYASSEAESKVCYADKKIRDLRTMINNHGTNTKIIIDGRVSLEDIAEYGENMVDIFVVGTTCISSKDIAGTATRVMSIRNKFLANHSGDISREIKKDFDIFS